MSAVCGGIFVGFGVADHGVRLLAAASKNEGGVSVKKLHDHQVTKNTLQKAGSLLVSVLTITGLEIYTMMTVKREMIPESSSQGREAQMITG